MVEILNLPLLSDFFTYRTIIFNGQIENMDRIMLFKSLNLLTVFHVTDSSFAISLKKHLGRLANYILVTLGDERA